MPRPHLAALAALATLSSAACLSGPRSQVRHLAPPPVDVAPSPLPVTLGLHAPPDARAAWWASHLGAPIVPIGADAIDLVQASLGTRFGPLPVVPAPPPFGASPPATDLVLVPTVADFSTYVGYQSASPGHAVALRLALFDARGDLVSTWTVRGSEPVPAPPPAPASTDPLDQPTSTPGPDGLAHAGLNLAAATHRLATAFKADARLDAWLARRVAGGPSAIEGLELEAAHADGPVDYPGTKATLFENGLVAVRVRVANRGPSPVALDGLHAQLRLADGRVIQRIGTSMALGRLAFSSSMARLAKLRAYGPLFGGIAASSDGFKELNAIPTTRALLEALALEPGLVAPAGALEGALLFMPQQGGPAGGPATLELWATDVERRHFRAERAITLPAPPESRTLPGE